MPALVEYEHAWIIPAIFIAWFVCKAAGRVFDKVADLVGNRLGPFVRDWPRPILKWDPPKGLKWLQKALTWLFYISRTTAPAECSH
ncbi:hypothetical protein CNMCM5793_000205 [Aspergillus hiratsukae]|uniref:Uncharacterized protein n=1 Tax=Aspergillus hiratsukae TaxID=1194566 RepID=A0A8H6UDA9_9EURO|nr:hypothetical protein CNMCM5793_000205 [Aspergillus hiratsukae]KAF7164047.1 hypothetical protein CNMCM6106_000741 [Aspergillus hiratsukae]